MTDPRACPICGHTGTPERDDHYQCLAGHRWPIEGTMGPNWIQTAAGVAFDLEAPRAEDVRAGDLAHALAGINRFGGHLRVPHYSVAQHSILCAVLLWQRTRDRLATTAALLHDAHEAYTGDLKAPLKALINACAPGCLRDLEGGIDHAIAAWAQLELGQGAADVRRLIKTADLQLLFWERDRWMSKAPRAWIGEAGVVRLAPADFGVETGSALLDAWSPTEAEAAFHWALGLLLPDGAPAVAATGARLGRELATAFRGCARAVR